MTRVHDILFMKFYKKTPTLLHSIQKIQLKLTMLIVSVLMMAAEHFPNFQRPILIRAN